MNTILLATDGSPSAQKATDLAIEMAAALDARLRIVAVWHYPVYEYGYFAAQLPAGYLEYQREGAEQAVERAAEAARDAGVSATSQVRQGLAQEEICAAATETAAELIVIGARGWGAVRRLVFGSVSNAVLHHAECPVLVVRSDAEELVPAAANIAPELAHR